MNARVQRETMENILTRGCADRKPSGQPWYHKYMNQMTVMQLKQYNKFLYPDVFLGDMIKFHARSIHYNLDDQRRSSQKTIF